MVIIKILMNDSLR